MEHPPVAPDELLGTWRLERRIVDRPLAALPDRAGRRPPPQFGRVTGTLTLAASAAADADVSWLEQGTLTWGGQTLPVSRRLVIRRAVDRGPARNAGWTVCFDDGRVFHEWTPGVPVVHPCRADTYRGVVDVDPTGRELRVLWDVHGPEKDRRLFTRCTRL